MVRRMIGAVLLGWCATQAGWADLTLRHTISVEFGTALPPQAVDAMKRQVGNRMPRESTLAIKGERTYASMGQMFAITDYAKGEITLVDPATRRFATVPLAEYTAKVLAAQKLKPMPPDAQRIFDSMRLDVKTSKTGETATVQGIRVEENLLSISMDVTAGMQLRTEIHIWTAAAGELQRTPALRELAAYTARAKAGPNPMEIMTKALAGLPGMGQKLRAPMEEMMKGTGGAVIRMRAATYMAPMTDQPVTDVTMDLSELSEAPIPDSRFLVPAGYETAAMEDLLGALMPESAAAPAVSDAAGKK